MGIHDVSTSTGSSTESEEQHSSEYLPPRLVRLGSLAELTLGGSNGPDDGFGGAGDEGSV